MEQKKAKIIFIITIANIKAKQFIRIQLQGNCWLPWPALN
jgi:hypothetical protein